MPRVPVHTIDDAPEQSREALSGLERRMGRLLNIHAEMAHAPVVLAAHQGIQTAIARQGSFDAKTREAIALAVGAVDKCAYCQSAHTAGGQAAGWSLEETVAIRDGTANVGPKLGSLLAVAREIAGNTGHVADATWQAAREAGWNDAELAELFAHVAANLFTNYFNHYMQTEPDLPAAPGLEGWSPAADGAAAAPGTAVG
jgi:AhpD family alkylhydroperoxidase